MPLINFSGLASGIDSEALIEATSEATRAARVTPLETEVTELTETNSALAELATLLDAVKDAADTFRTVNGGGIAKIGASADETIVSAVASDSAALGTYDISVDQLASNALFSFAERTSDTNANVITTPGESGAISITYGLGDEEKTISVDADENTSWTELTGALNAAALDEGMNITASLVNVGTSSSPSYALFINGNEIGLDKGTLTVDTDATHSTNGGTNSALGTYLDDTTATLNQATNAQFQLSGITGTIERTSNTVNDLITGVTFNLQDTSTGSTTVKIEVDSATTESRVQEIVDAYNELVAFVNENNLITRQENGEEVTNIFSPLASTRVDDNSITAIRNAMISSSYDADGDDADLSDENAIRIFADLGIITDGNIADGTLIFETDDANLGFSFQEALALEPDSVEQILANFADRIASTAGTIDQFTGFNRIIDVSERGNEDLIRDLNDRISRAEDSIAQTEASLRARFARLEALTADLQNQQQALTSALAGLG